MKKFRLSSLLILLCGLLFVAQIQAQINKPKPKKINFSSVYTNIDYDKCLEIGEFDPQEPRDLPLICEGYGQYKIYVSTHNRNTAYISKNVTKNNVPDDAASFVIEQKARRPIIEWRLANGVPFACIVRLEGDAKIFPEIANENDVVNYLVIKNLPGFKSFTDSIDANKVRNANQSARQKADANYGKL